jgi:hypothetical protein
MKRETMQRQFALVFALVVIAVLALTTVVIAADNNIGTWKLNLAKSNYSRGPGQALSITSVYERQ